MTTEKPIVLYGSPMSLYTARVRRYFIKRGIAFSEQPPHASKHFHENADESERNSILNLLKSCDMDSLVDMKLIRAVSMQNNLEVWGPITGEV